MENEINLTTPQLKALIIMKNTSWEKTFSAAGFAKQMWVDSNMHTTSKNTGHGACTGKAAWLCGGSYLQKLRKKGWICVTGEYLNEFYISLEGRKILKEQLTKQNKL